MEPEKKPDVNNESKTQPGASDGNKDEGNKDPKGQDSNEPKGQNLDADIEKKRTVLENLKKAAEEEQDKLVRLRTERRNLGGNPPVREPSNNDSLDDDPPPEGPGGDVIKSALDIFYRYHPEYKPENDIGNELYGKLDSHFRRIRPGTKVQDVLDDLEYIHDHFIKPELGKSEDQGKDEQGQRPGIGDTTGVQQKGEDDVEKVASRMKAKASDQDKQFAKMHSGGEDAYWTQRAKSHIAERRGKTTSNLL